MEQYRFSSHDVQEELDEHLDAINRNTNELQSCFEFITEVEKKVDKLSEKMDTVLSMLESNSSPAPKVEPLSIREQEVFLALYTTEEFLTHKQIAQKVALSEAAIPQIIEAIIDKNIPLLKKFTAGSVLMQIDAEFKNEQAKHNILKIDSVVMQEFAVQK